MLIHKCVNIIFQCTSRTLAKMKFYCCVCCFTIFWCLPIRERERDKFIVLLPGSLLQVYIDTWTLAENPNCVALEEPSCAGLQLEALEQTAWGQLCTTVTWGTSNWHVFSCGIFKVVFIQKLLICYIWFPGNWYEPQDPSFHLNRHHLVDLNYIV